MLQEGIGDQCHQAAALIDELPKAKRLLADRGYDAGWFRDALQANGITRALG